MRSAVARSAISRRGIRNDGEERLGGSKVLKIVPLNLRFWRIGKSMRVEIAVAAAKLRLL